MISDRYDVVVVPFPFDDIPVRKRRPVLILSGRQFNQANNHSIVAMITTAKETNWPSDVQIEDRTTAGLLVPCVVRFRLQTMPNALMVRFLGKLGPLDRLRCERQFAGILA
ncbi:MAG: type II toxin-antitoxin system PemK/MazF family toxin [Rhizobiaceae bacterium]